MAIPLLAVFLACRKPWIAALAVLGAPAACWSALRMCRREAGAAPLVSQRVFDVHLAMGFAYGVAIPTACALLVTMALAAASLEAQSAGREN